MSEGLGRPGDELTIRIDLGRCQIQIVFFRQVPLIVPHKPQLWIRATVRIAKRPNWCYESLMHDHRDIIDRWPSVKALADDLGIPYVNVNMMRQRNSISVRHWERVVEAAKARGIRGVNMVLLARTHRPRPLVRSSDDRASA